MIAPVNIDLGIREIRQLTSFLKEKHGVDYTEYALTAFKRRVEGFIISEKWKKHISKMWYTSWLVQRPTLPCLKLSQTRLKMSANKMWYTSRSILFPHIQKPFHILFFSSRLIFRAVMVTYIEFGRYAPYYGLIVVLPTVVSFLILISSVIITSPKSAIYVLLANFFLLGVYVQDLLQVLPPPVSETPKIGTLQYRRIVHQENTYWSVQKLNKYKKHSSLTWETYFSRTPRWNWPRLATHLRGPFFDLHCISA